MDNYNKWQSFWDMFEFVVNRNIDIFKNPKKIHLQCIWRVEGQAQPNLQQYNITELPLAEHNFGNSH